MRHVYISESFRPTVKKRCEKAENYCPIGSYIVWLIDVFHFLFYMIRCSTNKTKSRSRCSGYIIVATNYAFVRVRALALD